MTDNRLNDSTATSGASRPSLDDAALGALIRSAADGWTAPPQRLGRPTWRDLVAGQERRRRGFGDRWFRRLAGAAAAAVTATVALALVAVWLTGPRAPGLVGSSASGSPSGSSAAASSPAASAAGGSAAPSVAPSSPGSAGPTASAAPAGPTAAPSSGASPLPVHAVFGAPVPDAGLLVVAGDSFRSLDLGTGSLSGPIADRSSGQSAMWPQRDGSSLCACLRRVTTIDEKRGIFDGIEVRILRIAPDGTILSEVSSTPYQALRDPAIGEDAPRLEVIPSLAADGHRLYLGWAKWVTGAWAYGVDVVDVASGRVLQSLPITGSWAPDVQAAAVRAVAAPDGGHVMLLSYAYTAAGATIIRSMAGVAPDGDLLVAGVFPSLAADASAAAACAFPDEGFATAAIYYAICPDGTLHRLTPEGVRQPDVTVPGMTAGALAVGGGARSDPTRGRLYVWDPFAHALAAVDAVNGVVLGTVVAPRATGAVSPMDRALRAVGDWLAPPAAAKIALAPAVQLSPDGLRLYALGVTGSGIEDGGGSAGVFAFDLASLTFTGRWAPTADLSGISLSQDGSVLYATGLEGVDATGAKADQPASLTAFDTATGEVRLILGALAEQVDLALDRSR